MTTRNITYTIDCRHCDGEASYGAIEFDQPDDGSIVIDLTGAVSQQTFTCTDCGCRFSADDLSNGVQDRGDECRDLGGDESEGEAKTGAE